MEDKEEKMRTLDDRYENLTVLGKESGKIPPPFWQKTGKQEK